jgi:MFS family permease
VLWLAAAAVGFAAADTYVVVVALPDMMTGVGLAVDELQRAAPIVSGFLLGYVAVLPLIGRIADVRGRVPVLVASLVVFALGSLVTAAAYDLPSMVAGRFLQGLGAGGLVPATLALVADRYPPDRRGMPLGMVGAVQELGSVAGPLYGAVVLAVSAWQAIFAVNLVVGLVLAAGLRSSRTPAATAAGAGSGTDVLGAALVTGAVVSLVLTMVQPPRLTTDVTLGLAFVPVAGQSRWWAPAGLAAIAFFVAFVVRCLRTPHPVVDLRGWWSAAGHADLRGATLLALALAGVVLAFAGADPEVALLAPAGPWLLLASAGCLVGLLRHLRRAPEPLVPHGALAGRGAWGALAVSFFVGAALIAALVDIPIFARVTVDAASQLDAALVLVRFLVALPVGALVGGYLTSRAPAGAVAGAGMLLALVAFTWMSRWSLTSLDSPTATVPLVLGGLGFGVTLAPVNAALLAATRNDVHGVASALLVVSRMVGMLVGISALTTIGLRRYYAIQVDLPLPGDVCSSGTQCAAYTRLLKEAGLAQLHTVFVGAAGCALMAAVLSVLLLGAGTVTATAPRSGTLRP